MSNTGLNPRAYKLQDAALHLIGKKVGQNLPWLSCHWRGFPWCTTLIWKISKKSPKGWYSADNMPILDEEPIKDLLWRGLVVKAIFPKQNFNKSVRDEHEKQFLFRIVKCHKKTKKKKTNTTKQNCWLHNIIKVSVHGFSISYQVWSTWPEIFPETHSY